MIWLKLIFQTSLGGTIFHWILLCWSVFLDALEQLAGPSCTYNRRDFELRSIFNAIFKNYCGVMGHFRF